MKLLAVDGNSIANRAFYGIKILTTKSGEYTNAIYGFMNILLKAESDEQPDAVAIAFDLAAPTFRHEAYKEYKAQRKPMADEFASQMPLLKQLLRDLGYTIVEKEGYEADDVLGSFARACKAENWQCVLLTGDRDSYQLVGEGTAIRYASTQMGKADTTLVDEAYIEEKYGLAPLDLIQVKALQGDASDNIPGVAGIGEKTALSLIQKWKTVENLYANLDDDSIAKGVRAKLEAGKADAEMSLSLAKIHTELPLGKPAEYIKQAGDPAAAAALLSRLEMQTLLNRLNLTAASAPQEQKAKENELPLWQPQPLPAKPDSPLYLLPLEKGWQAFDAKAVYQPQSDAPEFWKVLKDKGVEKQVYDAKALYHLGLDHDTPVERVSFDALLAGYLLNPMASTYQPGPLAAEYGAEPAFRCGGDCHPAAPTFANLCARLSAELEAQNLDKVLREMELPLSEVLAQMEHTGFLVDAEGIRAFGKELEEMLAKTLDSIHQQVGYEFNVNSPKQLGEALFGKLGLPTLKKTKSGFSTDAETLESLRTMHPVVDSVLEYRTYSKLNSTYVSGLLANIEEDGRIHTVFNQTEARTGRLSSIEPNLQNIPIRTELGSKLRKYFVAPPGHVLVDADYSQIELRILAHISEDEAMIEAFRQGEDIHRMTAARIFGLPPEMVTSQLRSRAKAVNFGIVYGIGAFSLAKNTGVSQKEASEFIKNYLLRFPGVAKYMEDIVAFGKEHGYVETLYGRRRALPELKSSNAVVRAAGQRIAMNTPIQGTAADIIKMAMIHVAQRLEKEKLQAKLILQVHDELIVESPEAEAAQVAKVVEEEMEGVLKMKAPLLAEVHRGKSWYEAKS